MDGRTVTARDGCDAGASMPDPDALCSQSLAALIQACLYEWVRNYEPSAQVWQRILACISGSCPASPERTAPLPSS
jgi:hypothetical protein